MSEKPPLMFQRKPLQLVSKLLLWKNWFARFWYLFIVRVKTGMCCFSCSIKLSILLSSSSMVYLSRIDWTLWVVFYSFPLLVILKLASTERFLLRSWILNLILFCRKGLLSFLFVLVSFWPFVSSMIVSAAGRVSDWFSTYLDFLRSQVYLVLIIVGLHDDVFLFFCPVDFLHRLSFFQTYFENFLARASQPSFNRRSFWCVHCILFLRSYVLYWFCSLCSWLYTPF